MNGKITPPMIYDFLAQRVLGQDDVLRKIAVVVYKHIHGISGGNILLIGNSGTGKTTVMKAVRQFYQDRPELRRFTAMAVMNANTLIDEQGEVNINRMFKNIEIIARNLLGPEVTVESLCEYMEGATVCLDEVDKISARVAGKVNVSGITIQQAVLTVMEGETVFYDTHFRSGDRVEAVKIPIDTGKLLFISGGAFEELYDQVFKLVEDKKDERRLQEVAVWNDEEGRMNRKIVFKLKDCLKLSDLFGYGMMPQFISRFSAVAVLDDLGPRELKQILLTAEDSPFRHSRDFFRSMGLELHLTDDALDAIAGHAAQNTRIGARALREVFNRIAARIEFDPLESGLLRPDGDRQVIVIDRQTVLDNLSW